LDSNPASQGQRDMARQQRCLTVAGGIPAAAGVGSSLSVGSSGSEGMPADDLHSLRSGSQQWADPGACAALCALILDDRKEPPPSASTSSQPRRRALPPALYAEEVAPFLRFDTPLPNMLYAFGGRNQSRGPLDAAEMFDTWHGRWVSVAPMPTRRAGSAAALLPDRRIMVIGGYNENGIAEGLLSTCDVYDPVTQCWDDRGAAPLARKRWGHGCATLGGKVYVVGGCSLPQDAQPDEAFMETLKCCEVYSPDENRWRKCAALQIARSGSRVVVLDERHLAAVGGCDDVFGRAESQPTVEIYDSATQLWSLLASRLESPRTTAAVAAIGSTRLLVVGGAPSLSSSEVYDVQLSGTRTGDEDGDDTMGLATPRRHVNDEDDEASVPGDMSMSLPGDMSIHSDDFDDVVRRTITPARAPRIEDLPEGRMGCQAAVVSLPRAGGSYPLADQPCVVIVGGERCDDPLNDGEFPRVSQFTSIPVFDVETGAWRKDSKTVMPEMTAARTAVALCVGFGRASPLP